MKMSWDIQNKQENLSLQSENCISVMQSSELAPLWRWKESAFSWVSYG